MKCNWRRWLWGLIPILMLAWVAAQAERGRIEQDLADRAGAALAGNGAAWAVAAFDGRDVVLSGRAPDEGEPGKASKALQGVWGVRTVENRADLLEKAENYIWGASRRGQRVRLTGYAPTLATKQVIIGVVKANFPGFEIVDRTRLARGVPPLDTWLAGISFGLRQLASLKRGDVRLDGLNLSVMGEAEDPTEYRSVRTALTEGVPKAIKLVNNQVSAPSVSPYTWSAKFGGGQLVLSGHMPNEAGRSHLQAIAKASKAQIGLDDRMQPASGEPADWDAAAAAGLRALLLLENGSAEISDAALTLSGMAADDATLGAVRTALRTVPEAFKVTDHIKVPEPLVIPAPPPLPPRPAELEPAPPPVIVAIQQLPAAPAPIATQALPKAKPMAIPPPPAGVVPAIDVMAEARARACQDTLTRIATSGRILFRVGSADLESASFETLDGLAGAAKTCPDLHIEIAGHASSEGSTEINQQLSVRRAQSVVAYLVKSGVDAARLEAAGYGATRPIAPNDKGENMARNRRIEFVVRAMK